MQDGWRDGRKDEQAHNFLFKKRKKRKKTKKEKKKEREKGKRKAP